MPDLPGLVELARRLLDLNKESPEQVTTGDTRRGRRLWVFERAGQPCRRCGTSVALAEQGTYRRVAYWCPRCQPGPAPPPLRRADRPPRPAG